MVQRVNPLFWSGMDERPKRTQADAVSVFQRSTRLAVWIPTDREASWNRSIIEFLPDSLYPTQLTERLGVNALEAMD